MNDILRIIDQYDIQIDLLIHLVMAPAGGIRTLQALALV